MISQQKLLLLFSDQQWQIGVATRLLSRDTCLCCSQPDHLPACLWVKEAVALLIYVYAVRQCSIGVMSAPHDINLWLRVLRQFTISVPKQPDVKVCQFKKRSFSGISLSINQNVTYSRDMINM